jgi:SHS2 domain-containing protein
MTSHPKRQASSTPTGATPPRWHRFLEHTGEVRLQVGAESWSALLAEAGRALGLLLLGSARVEGLSAPLLVEIRAHDAEALLVDWLNEILFLAETELWVPVEIEVLMAEDDHLRASVRGVPVAEPPSLVKAATLHGLRIRRQGEGRAAEVVLDV